MSHVIGEKQADAVRALIAKEIKKHLRQFAKTTDRTVFTEFLQDWEWSLKERDPVLMLYRAFRQLGGITNEITIKI